jgi:hypothetical protein
MFAANSAAISLIPSTFNISPGSFAVAEMQKLAGR